MNEQLPTQSGSSAKEGRTNKSLPNIFKYLDYRIFLADCYTQLKSVRPSFSYSLFAKLAGLQTPNYLKRVIDGERPITPENLPKFCLALKLKPKESLYFEALVNYNQSRDEKVRVYYFGLLKQASKGQEGAAVEIFSHQYEVFSSWYFFPVRELVLLKDFQETPDFIAKRMKNKITPKQAKHAIETLLKVGLLVRNEETKKLEQAAPQIEYSKDAVNLSVRKFHHEMLSRTGMALEEDAFSTWNVRSLTIGVKKEDIPIIQKEIDKFTAEINQKYTTTDKCDEVIQINNQIFQLTNKE